MQEAETRSPDVRATTVNAADATLMVVHADVPLYPSLALAAHQSGTVRLRISVKQGAVLSADALSSAPPILQQAAKDNVSTWRFTPDVNGALEVKYIYELEEADRVVPENPRISMQLPSVVRITAKPVKAIPMRGK
jgi:TonB family protein